MPTQPQKYKLTHEGLIFNVKEFKTLKHMKVIIRPDNTITITCRPGTPKISVGNFILEKLDWIKKIIKKNENSRKAVNRYITVFKSRNHRLEFETHEKNYIKVEFSGEIILVKYPKTLDICSEQVQRTTYKAIVMALKKEAAEYIPARLRELATAKGLTYKSLSITSTRTKWGSCSSLKAICISCFVMILSDELIDLVLLHELAHTVYMNHSPRFHEFLNSLLPGHNEKELNKKLKEYHIIKP